MAGHIARADQEKADDSGVRRLWDCGSTLFDSYELTAVKRQLGAAVLLGARSLSMPHLPAGAVQVQPSVGRRRRWLPALLRRLFPKVLRLRFLRGSSPSSRHVDRRYGGRAYDGIYGGHSGTGSPWSGALTSIPEESGASPELGSPPVDPTALRRAQSERFIGSKTASSMVQFDVVM